MALHHDVAQDRLRALRRGEALPRRADGAAWFADISRFAAGPRADRYFIVAPKIATSVGCDSAQRSSAARLFHQPMPSLLSAGRPAAPSTTL